MLAKPQSSKKNVISKASGNLISFYKIKKFNLNEEHTCRP